MIKKIVCCFIIAVLLSAAAGCSGSVQLEDRNYVMALGVDYAEGQLEATFSFPDLKALTGDGDNIHYPVISIKGESMQAITDIYKTESNKQLDFGQLQIIVFGQGLLSDKAALTQFLSYIKINQAFTRTILICEAKERAKEIIALDDKVNGSIGLYIKDMFENNGAAAGYEKAVINDMIISWENPGEKFKMAVIEPVGGELPSIGSIREFSMDAYKTE